MRDDGTAILMEKLADGSMGSTLRLFMDSSGCGALLATNKTGRLGWFVIFGDGRRIAVPTKSLIAWLQNPFAQAPICRRLFATADGPLLQVTVFSSDASFSHHAISLQEMYPPQRASKWMIGDIAAVDSGERPAIAVRVLHDPCPGMTCVYVIPAGRVGDPVLRTPPTALKPQDVKHALSRDGRHLLLCQGTAAVCYAIGQDALVERWRLQASGPIRHALPCGLADFAFRTGGEVRAVRGGDGETLYSLCDFELFGRPFALSDDGRWLVHEDLTVRRFIGSDGK